jgi:hypothetical protein
LRDTSPVDIYDWDGKVMKEVLIEMSNPLTSYAKSNCVKAMIGLFYHTSEESGVHTPVLSRSSSAQPEVDDQKMSAAPPDHITRMVEDALRAATLTVERSRLDHPVEPPVTNEDRDMMISINKQLEVMNANSHQRSASSMPSAGDMFNAVGPAAAVKDTAASLPRSPPQVHPGVPEPNEFFNAAAAQASFEEEGLATGNDNGLRWVFFPDPHGGPMTARQVARPAATTRIHSRQGGSEDLYTETAVAFHPFAKFMQRNRGQWLHVGLFREAITDAVALDSLAMMPSSGVVPKAVRDAREVLVRRWLCLKWVASRTPERSVPRFPPYATGFESLLTQQDRMPAAAVTTAMVNSKYAARVLKAQAEQ